MQDIEEEHRQRLTLAGRSDVDAAPEARRGHLELLRATVGAQRDGLTVGHERRDRQRQGGLDDLREPGRDLVQAARVDRHVLTVAVDLHARAVELGLEHRLTAEPLQRVGHVAGGLGQHGADRSPDLQRTNRSSAGGTVGQHGGGDRRQLAAEHRGATYGAGGHGGCLGHGVGHDTDQRTLPQLAGQQRT